MILQIDSGFRDYNKYPYNSEMCITINGRPISEKNDIRSTNLTENYIQSLFRWVGNSDFNNPLSRLKNDTFLTKIIPINSNQCIIIPENDEIKNLIDTVDYFIGIDLWIEETNLSSSIIFYDKRFFLVTLNEDIFQVYFTGLTYDDCDEHNNLNHLSIDGYFVNSSYHEKNNIVLLGKTKTNFQQSTKFVISNGPYRGLIVENVTKNWKRRITEINGIFRHVLLEDIPSYDSNDTFILYQDPTLIRNEKKTFFQNGIEDISIISFKQPPTYQEKFKYKGILLQVKNLLPLEVIILKPGNNIFEKEITLHSISGNELSIRIEKIGNGIIMKDAVSLNYKLYIIGLIDIFRNDVYYFTIQNLKGNLIYLDFTFSEDFFTHIEYLYFIPFRQVFPNLVIPTVPTQNLICVQTQLVSLILPNLPICGYNIYLADIPYVFVNLSNSQGQGCEISSTIYSNVPNAVSNNFVCPIANVRNPRINFVILSCKQTAIFKFSPRDSLIFRVSLPDGNLLKYANNTYSNSFGCPPLDIPLNINQTQNGKVVYPYILNNTISAIFEMKILG